MSWRNSGGSRGSGYRSRNDEGSVFEGGSAGGPPLTLLIGACVVLGVLGLGLAIAFGGNNVGTAQTAGSGQATGGQATGGQATGGQATGGQATGGQIVAGQESTSQAAAGQPSVPPTAAAAPTAAPAGGVPTEAQGPAVAEGEGEEAAEVGTDELQQIFNPAELTLPANTLVTLTFNNLSQVVQHNWVLLEGGDDVANAVNNAALGQVTRETGAAAAVPPADTPGLLVAVPILNPGDSYSVTFETPDAGAYQFICTFPGHYAQGMRGELTVE